MVENDHHGQQWEAQLDTHQHDLSLQQQIHSHTTLPSRDTENSIKRGDAVIDIIVTAKELW